MGERKKKAAKSKFHPDHLPWMPGPTLSLKGGGYASEITDTVETRKGWINKPTIDPVRRMSVTDREGIRMEESQPGGAKYYKTVEKAVKAAEKRSAAGGRYRKRKKKMSKRKKAN